MIIKSLVSSKLLARELNKKIFNFQRFNFAKIIPLKLGDLGEGTKEATVRQWYKGEGDIVHEVIFFKLL